jgi:hypothetical protein
MSGILKKKSGSLTKKSPFLKTIFFQKIPKFKIYYAKWTLRIEVVNSKKPICYFIFSVYFVTGTKNPDNFKIIFLYHH